MCTHTGCDRPELPDRPRHLPSLSPLLSERPEDGGGGRAGRGAGRGAVITQHQACSTGRGHQCGMDHASGVCKSRSEADRVCGCGPSTSSTNGQCPSRSSPCWSWRRPCSICGSQSSRIGPSPPLGRLCCGTPGNRSSGRACPLGRASTFEDVSSSPAEEPRPHRATHPSRWIHLNLQSRHKQVEGEGEGRRGRGRGRGCEGVVARVRPSAPPSAPPLASCGPCEATVALPVR